MLFYFAFSHYSNALTLNINDVDKTMDEIIEQTENMKQIPRTIINSNWFSNWFRWGNFLVPYMVILFIFFVWETCVICLGCYELIALWNYWGCKKYNMHEYKYKFNIKNKITVLWIENCNYIIINIVILDDYFITLS